MTEEEAIELLQNLNVKLTEMAGHKENRIEKIFGWNEITGICEAIKTLEQIQQYRAIGTVEECRAAVEKQTAKKPPVINRPNIFVKVPVCPNCSTQEHYQPIYGKAKYCSNCGQKLDLDN